MFKHQQQFQNAGQNGSFSYNSIGNQTSTFFVLLMMLVLLVALLQSEARCRALLERLHQETLLRYETRPPAGTQ